MSATRRVFLPWSEPALPAAARVLADRHENGRALPLDAVTVAFPGARAGRRLTELLVEEADARDLVLSPPRVTTVGALPEQLYEPDRPLAEQPLSLRLWSLCLRELEPEQRSLLFPEPPEPRHLHRWDRLARLVHRLHRESAGQGLDFGDVAASFRERQGYDDSGRWRALATAQEDYHRRLRDLGHADRDAARLRALQRGAVSTDHRIYLLGVVEMTGVTRRMLESLDGDAPVTALVHAPETRADAFDPLGCVRQEVWADEQIRIDDESIVRCGRPPSQADATLRCLSGEGRPLAPDEITVGVPDDQVVPFLEERLEAHDVPHRYAAGTPLPRTEPYRLLSAVADYLEGGRFQELAALLRHPRIARLSGVADPLERADRYFQKRLPARVAPAGAGTTGDSSGRKGPFGKLLGGLERELELDRLRRSRPLGQWMPEILALLQRAYGDERLHRSRPAERRLVEALEAVVEAAAGLHRLPEVAQETCDGATSVRLLLSRLRDSAIPPVPERSAVELLGWLELHLDDAPVLILTGFNEGKVPESVSADLFLPDTLRQDLGLPNTASRYARDAYLLTATLASREEATILVGRRDLEGDPLRPSRLLLATSGRELAARARRLFTEEVPESAPVRRLGLETDGPGEFSSPPEPVIRIPEVPETLRVTEFSLLLQDPYRWALERHLGLSEQHDRDRELDGAAFGSLAHEVLHGFAGTEEASSTDPARVAERVSALLDDEARRRYGSRALPAVRLQVEQLRARLREFALWHARRMADGWETVYAEVKTPDGGVPFDVDGTPVRLTGRIDRIDRHRESGRWAVLDYKTWERPRSPDDRHRAGRHGQRRWVDLQLPLYRHLLPAMVTAAASEGGDAVDDRASTAGPEAGLDSRPAAGLAGVSAPGAEVELGYVNLSREGVVATMADWSAEELVRADEAARDVVRLLRGGRVEFRPGEGRSYRRDPFEALLGRNQLPAAGRADPEPGPDGGTG